MISFLQSLVSLIVKSEVDGFDQFANWAWKHEKYYPDTERLYRFTVFSENLRIVANHNSLFFQGQTAYQLELNQFADLTFEEFRLLYLEFDEQTHSADSQPLVYQQTNFAASFKDWTTELTNIDMFDQQRCVASWAFAVADAVAFQKAISLSKIVFSRSPQELIDCVSANQGCSGGTIENALDYGKAQRLHSSLLYPQVGSKQTCQQKTIDDSYTIKGYQTVIVNQDKNSLVNALQTKVLISFINVSDITFQLYKSGIFDGKCDGPSNYFALIVAVDTDDTKPYAKLKMSWGSWGEKGYIRLSLKTQNQCGIYRKLIAPII